MQARFPQASAPATPLPQRGKAAHPRSQRLCKRLFCAERGRRTLRGKSALLQNRPDSLGPNTLLQKRGFCIDFLIRLIWIRSIPTMSMRRCPCLSSYNRCNTGVAPVIQSSCIIVPYSSAFYNSWFLISSDFAGKTSLLSKDVTRPPAKSLWHIPRMVRSLENFPAFAVLIKHLRVKPMRSSR